MITERSDESSDLKSLPSSNSIVLNKQTVHYRMHSSTFQLDTLCNTRMLHTSKAQMISSSGWLLKSDNKTEI